ncbi:MAG: hypothetical protein JWR07_4488 [Nevskia sp.]|nr:hypothetical protein [Nevskia sp.]
MDTKDPRIALAWALFRAEEPENLGEPDPGAWKAFFLPRAQDIIFECAANGFELTEAQDRH